MWGILATFAVCGLFGALVALVAVAAIWDHTGVCPCCDAADDPIGMAEQGCVYRMKEARETAAKRYGATRKK